MEAYVGYILQMKTLYRGWPVMVHDTHMRRRSEMSLITDGVLVEYEKFATFLVHSYKETKLCKCWDEQQTGEAAEVLWKCLEELRGCVKQTGEEQSTHARHVQWRVALRLQLT